MRKIKKINGFLVVKFNDREKREYEGTALGEYGVIDAEVYTGNLDIDRGAMEYDDADTLEVAVELARGLESEEDITDEPPTYTAAVETNESYTEEAVEPAALIEGWTRRLATQVKSKHYPDTDPRTAAHELYGFKMALHQIGFLPESEVITDPDTFGAGRLDGPMPRNPEELLAFVCDERCKNRAGHTQEELDAICAKCPLGQLYEDAEAQDLRIRERSERALREHIEGVRHAEDTVTALLGGHEALAYLAALRDGQILQENECEHYAAQIAEAGAAWETVLEGVSFEDLSRLRHLLREVDEYTKGGGELFNGFQHETERIPAHRLEELHQLGTALLGECPENDCTIYRNVFRMAVDVDGQMGKLTGHARETMQREYERLLREHGDHPERGDRAAGQRRARRAGPRRGLRGLLHPARHIQAEGADRADRGRIHPQGAGRRLGGRCEPRHAVGGRNGADHGKGAARGGQGRQGKPRGAGRAGQTGL